MTEILLSGVKHQDPNPFYISFYNESGHHHHHLMKVQLQLPYDHDGPDLKKGTTAFLIL
jgi:hypothetical protein